MPRFRVMLRCDSLTILFEDQPRDVGFFTTRAVDAPTEASAVEVAKRLVRADLVSRTNDDPASLVLEVEEVAEHGWWWCRMRPPRGFAFFGAEEDENEPDAIRPRGESR